MTHCHKLSPTASAHPADVVAAKLILRSLGHYEAPSWGISEYPDRDLFDAIKDFQAKQGLKVDGVINRGGETVQAMAQRIQAMGRNGDTILAHINPAEAELLDRVTDGGSINPITNLMEFYNDFDDGYDGTLDNDDDYSGFSSGGDFDDGYTSSGHIGGPDGSGETNGHGSNDSSSGGIDTPGGALSTNTDNYGTGATPSEETTTQSGTGKSRRSAMVKQGEEDPEGVTLGEDDFKDNGKMPKSSTPSNKTTISKAEVHRAHDLMQNSPNSKVKGSDGKVRTAEEHFRHNYEGYINQGDDILGVGTQYGHYNFNVSQQPGKEAGTWNRAAGVYYKDKAKQNPSATPALTRTKEQEEPQGYTPTLGGYMPANGYVGFDGKTIANSKAAMAAAGGYYNPSSSLYGLTNTEIADHKAFEDYTNQINSMLDDSYGWFDEEEEEIQEEGKTTSPGSGTSPTTSETEVTPSPSPARRGQMGRHAVRRNQQAYNYAKGFMRTAADGVLLGGQSELAGVVSAVYGFNRALREGMPVEQAWDIAQGMYALGEEEARAEEKTFAKANPGTAMGLKVGGGLLTGGAAGKGLQTTMKGASAVGRWGAGLSLGSLLGGGSGGLSADPGERLGGSLLGAGTSLLGGKITSAGSMLGRSVTNPSISTRNLLEANLPQNVVEALLSTGLTNLLEEKEDEDRAKKSKR